MENNKNQESPLEKLERGNQKHGMGLKARRRIGTTFSYIGLVLISIIWITPFVFLVLQSFETADPGWSARIIPAKFGFDNYVYLFSANADFNRWYFNTFIIALSLCIGQTAMQLAMAYVLSRFRFKMRKKLMNLMLILGMFPGFLTMIILYNVLKDLGLTQANAVPGLIIVGIASSGMGYYVIKGFFDTVSKSLDEAAMIDGATRAQVFVKVILPLAKPIVIYALLTAFMGPWAEFITAGYLLRSPQNFENGNPTTVAVQLQNMLGIQDGMRGRYWGQFAAGAVIVAIPTSILFIIMQKNYVSGVTGGAVKG